MWLSLVNPKSLICVFSSSDSSLTSIHTRTVSLVTRWSRLAPAAVKGALLCAAKRTLDGEDARPSIRLRVKR